MNEALIAPIVNFTVVGAILFKIGRKPFREFFANRSAAIGGAVTTARSEAQAAERILAEAKARVSGRDNLVAEQRAAAKRSLEQFRATRIASAEREAERIGIDGQRLAENERVAGRRKLRQELVTRSIDTTEQFFERDLDAKEKRKFVGEVLESVAHGT